MNENKYYFNDNLNYCAAEAWVVDYLFTSGMAASREEAVNNLREYPVFCGWRSCELYE